MRDILLEKIRPVTDELTNHVAELLQERIDAIIDDVKHALDVAFSAALGVVAPGAADMPAVVDAKLKERFTTAIRTSPPARPEKPPRASSPPAPGRSVCSKCQQPGHNARSCGRAPKGRPHTSKPAAATPAMKPDRTAAIAAAAPKSNSRISGTARAALARTRSATERWSKDEIEAATTIAEASKRDGTLPDPSSSWEVDRDEVRELDFDGASE